MTLPCFDYYPWAERSLALARSWHLRNRLIHLTGHLNEFAFILKGDASAKSALRHFMDTINPTIAAAIL